jgi:large subunit ribosomal protein L21
MFAVIETGSKQYRVQVGDIIKTEKMLAEAGASVSFDKIIAIGGKFGADISGSKVDALILEHRKNEKEIIFKKKRRHNYRRKRGHRQQITVLRITGVTA